MVTVSLSERGSRDEVCGGRIPLDDGDCGRIVCSGHYFVAGAFQHVPGELQDHLLVVHAERPGANDKAPGPWFRG